MTPQQTAIACADAIRDGLVANKDNPAGFWLELLVEFSYFAEATLGEESHASLMQNLAAMRGPTLN